MIESVVWLAMLLPVRYVLADGVLQVDILACLMQPGGETRPFADQRLVANFYGRDASKIVGCEQASDNKSIDDLS
jgi:hypothetical protein